MQHSPTEIKEKLLKALDSQYNVVDMAAVVEVISILERTQITKDALETTRLGKFINELRRKTKNENLAKRAKDLVRRWRYMILPTSEQVSAAPAAPAPAPVPAGQQYNGAGGHTTTPSRVVSSSGHLSPGLPVRGNISPGLPVHGRHLNRSATVSPAMSLPSSDRSNTSPRPTSRSSTPKPADTVSVSSKPSVSASAVDPVPKTHASNKRLRKEDSPADEKPAKKVKRPNGLSTEPTSHGMTNSLGRPDIVSKDESRDSFSPHSDHGSNSCEVIKTVVPSDSIQKDTSEPKKRGRKKGSKNKSKNFDRGSSKDSNVKSNISSIGRTHRVKTTQELLADLQARNTGLPSDNVVSSVPDSKSSLTNCLLPGTRGSDKDALEMSRNKTEHIAKFLRSQSDLELSNQEFPTNRDVQEDIKETQILSREEPDQSYDISRLSKDVKSPAGSNSKDALSVERPVSVQEIRAEVRQSPAPVPHPIGSDKTVEEILLRLPPVDTESIEWESGESPADSPVPKTVTEDDVCRLHSEPIEGVNGVANHGSQNFKNGDIDFREWHETVSRTSYQGEMLHILPYVVID